MIVTMIAMMNIMMIEANQEREEVDQEGEGTDRGVEAARAVEADQGVKADQGVESRSRNRSRRSTSSCAKRNNEYPKGNRRDEPFLPRRDDEPRCDEIPNCEHRNDSPLPHIDENYETDNDKENSTSFSLNNQLSQSCSSKMSYVSDNEEYIYD